MFENLSPPAVANVMDAFCPPDFDANESARMQRRRFEASYLILWCLLWQLHVVSARRAKCKKSRFLYRVHVAKMHETRDRKLGMKYMS